MSNTTIIVGAAGAIGKRLCAALSKQGARVIASDRMEHLPGSLVRSLNQTSDRPDFFPVLSRYI